MPLLYLAVSFLALLFPQNSQWPDDPFTNNQEINNQANGNQIAKVQAYVMDNGVHTDLVLPVQTEIVDWRQVFPLEDFSRLTIQPDYVALGWGDAEFYLNTPTWADLTLERSLKAAAGVNAALMHVTYLQQNQLGGKVYELPLSHAQYRQLVRNLLQHLQPALQLHDGATEASAEVVAGSGYSSQDKFYHARGRYQLFNTCNTWTGRRLAEVGVKVSPWTPLPNQVTWYLPHCEEC